MVQFVLKRTILSVPIALIVVVLVFSIIHLMPGDPALLMAGPQASPHVVNSIREQMGLDQPMYVQMWRYLSRLFQGDLGRSIVTGRPVASEIFGRLPNTVQLAFFSMAVATFVGVILGILAAVKRGSVFDRLSMATALFGISVPLFFIGYLLIYYFAFRLGWFPISGKQGPLFSWAGFSSLILPSLALGIEEMARVARLTRSSMLEVLGTDYIRTAKAKGLSQYLVIYKHALKNALIPIITVTGYQLARLMGGAVVVESVFAWPGIGRYLIMAIYDQDFPVIQGVLLITALLYVGINILVDVVYAVIDPRIRY